MVMLIVCYGCGGKGWVDSQYKGPVRCPICGGRGKLSRTETPQLEREENETEEWGPLPEMLHKAEKALSAKKPSANKNPLLQQLEDWLQNQPGIIFDHASKTMTTYIFMSKIKNRRTGLVWVSTYGASRILLTNIKDYTSVDKNNRVKYGAWGNYTEFTVQNEVDLQYAKTLIMYALNNF